MRVVALVVAVVCGGLLAFVARDLEAPSYPEQTGHLDALACQRGAAFACEPAQAWAVSYGDYELFELDATCMFSGNPFACEELAGSLRGEAAETGGLLPLARSRMTRALDLHLARCSIGDADSCLGASRIYTGGFGVEWNPRDARVYSAKACELGLAAACEQEGDRAHGSEAIARYSRACKLRPESPHTWLKLAHAQRAIGAEATASLQRACEQLAYDACAELAVSRIDLIGEPDGVIAAFARWCDDGDERACRLVHARVAL